jgi:hypothetical protein
VFAGVVLKDCRSHRLSDIVKRRYSEFRLGNLVKPFLVREELMVFVQDELRMSVEGKISTWNNIIASLSEIKQDRLFLKFDRGTPQDAQSLVYLRPL